MSTPQWSIECDYMESCNCDFGCSCNFSGLPNFGRCEALVGYHIRKRHFGEVPLDGLDFIFASSWPRAIHQGDGTACVQEESGVRVYIPHNLEPRDDLWPDPNRHGNGSNEDK